MTAEHRGPDPRRAGNPLSKKLLRAMERRRLSPTELRMRTGLGERALQQVLRGDATSLPPEAWQRLASVLGLEFDELARLAETQSRRRFDRRTNPVVEAVIVRHPRWFDGWSDDDFDDLYSRFGTGGALTWDGTVAAVEAINRRRAVLMKVTLLLETGQAERLIPLVERLYEEVVLCDAAGLRTADRPGGAGVPCAEDGSFDVDDAPGSAVAVAD